MLCIPINHKYDVNLNIILYNVRKNLRGLHTFYEDLDIFREFNSLVLIPGLGDLSRRLFTFVYTYTHVYDSEDDTYGSVTRNRITSTIINCRKRKKTVQT